MMLQPGTWLNHYQILAHLGTGGMGEVYRALDNKLQREVALKVLPKAFAQDPERVARFRREAQVLAQLNHVNIAAIYSVEQSGETHFLVMELALGDTLRERIQRGNQSRERERPGVALRAQPQPQPQPPLADARGSDGGIPLEEALDICRAREQAGARLRANGSTPTGNPRSLTLAALTTGQAVAEGEAAKYNGSHA